MHPISSFRLPAICKVSCSQVFYYFQHYSKKDGPGTKAVVRLGKLRSACPILTTYRSLLPWCPTQSIRLSSPTSVRSTSTCIPKTSRFKHCVPAYIYVITSFDTPQMLGTLVWCVPAGSSALHLFAHSQLTLQEPYSMSTLTPRISSCSLCMSRSR